VPANKPSSLDDSAELWNCSTGIFAASRVSGSPAGVEPVSKIGINTFVLSVASGVLEPLLLSSKSTKSTSSVGMRSEILSPGATALFKSSRVPSLVVGSIIFSIPRWHDRPHCCCSLHP
jgi:hypothetical protein